MVFTELPLKKAYLIETKPVQDKRGFLKRIYCDREFKEIGHGKSIVQINYTLTKKRGSIRGMHYQHPPFCETKIVQCTRGKIFDVIIDIRKNSSTFLNWHGEILSSNDMKMIYIPEGFAHGFQTLENNCELLYLHTEYYYPEYEDGIRFNDTRISIKWKRKVTEYSERDGNHKLLDDSFKGIEV
jgi:dTDP-4-dehydrorhamnose 3,5-epimerase